MFARDTFHTHLDLEQAGVGEDPVICAAHLRRTNAVKRSDEALEVYSRWHEVAIVPVGKLGEI
jgi:hypothetical protein